jgi:hypothetical protein
MKINVENFTTTIGWVPPIGNEISVHGLNENPEFIAGLNTKSLIIKFNKALNKKISKVMNVDIEGCEEIVFHVWSRNKSGRGASYKLSSDFAYKISFGGEEFFIPLFDSFCDVTLSVKNLVEVTKIEITCLHDDEDYLILSEMVAVKDEFPVDIWRSVKEQLESDISALYGKIKGGVTNRGIYIGKASADANTEQLVVSDAIIGGVLLLEKYALLKIKDAVNEELHQIDSNDGATFRLLSTYDGKQIINTYSEADLYLVIPVEFGLQETEIILPGISLVGLNPEEMIDINKLDHEVDTFKVDETVQSRGSDANFKYTVLIDCEARTNEMIAFMSLLVRFFLARRILWLNGKRIEIGPEGASSFVEPIEGFVEIPKIQYQMNVTIKEEVYSRESLVKTISNNRIFEVRR